MRPSMGSVGDAFDSAMCESFFAALECELLDRRRFKTQAEARIAVFGFIEGFYHNLRPHSSLGYPTPAEFVAKLKEQAAASKRATGPGRCGTWAPAPRPVASPPARGNRRSGLKPNTASFSSTIGS